MKRLFAALFVPLMLMGVSIAFVAGCGSGEASAPKPVNGNEPLPIAEAEATSNAYTLTPDRRPDLTELQIYQTVPRYSSIAPSPDGVIVDGRAHLADGTRWEMVGSGPEGPTVAITETLLGEHEPATYMWEVDKVWYASFADGPIYKEAESMILETLSYRPFNTRIRIIFYSAEEKPLASREFTVVGIKPVQ